MSYELSLSYFVKIMTQETSLNEISVDNDSVKEKTLHMRIQIYIIAALSNAATFISRIFTGYYAVFLNSTATALSLITSLRNLIQQAFQSTFGRLSDKIGRKIMIFIGLLISGISLALFPLIGNGWILIAGVAGFSLGFAAIDPAFTALQGDVTNRKNRAGFIGFITIIGATATTISLIFVGFMGELGEDTYNEFLIIFEIVAGLFFVAAIISLFIKEPDTERIEKGIAFSLKPVKENPTFRRFLIVNSIMSFFMSIGWPIFPLVRGNPLFASNLENTWIWAFFCLFQVIILLAVRPFINKIKRKTLLFIGRIGMFYVPVNLVITILWVPHWWHIAIGGALSGLCNALYWVGQNSYFLDCAPLKEKGTYTGIHNFFIGISTFVGSLIMGIIADAFMSDNEDWYVISIILIIIAVGRFLASFGFLFISEPKPTISEEKDQEENESTSL
ncbi:MAG: MFS transporter [Asgard group archaeon]|nr:MFS transporter [Asgard group archaeon]